MTDKSQQLASGTLLGKETIQPLSRNIKWSVRQKIMGIATSIIVFSIGISIFTTIRLMEVKHELIDLAEFTIPITDLISNVQAHSLEQQLHLQRIFRFYASNTLDREQVEKEKNEFENRGHEVGEEINKAKYLAHKGVIRAEIKSDIAIYKGLEKKVKVIEREYQDFFDDALHAINLLKKGKIQLAEHLEQKVIKEEDEFTKHIKEILQNLQQQTVLSAKTADKHEREVFWLAISATIIAVVGGLFYSIVIIGGFLRPIRDLVAKMHIVDKGNFDVEVKTTTWDEIGQLGHSFNAMIEELKLKNKIEETFGKYVDPRVVEYLLEGGGLQGTEGEKREMTVMFLGLTGLENLSSNLEPDALTVFYNEYLNLLGRPLSDHKGVIDKFIGTVVMGFWGPPFTEINEHAALALKTSKNLIASLPKLENLTQNHLGEYFTERTSTITIGVATGEMIVGNMGSASSMSYTVMGDVVNNASRLKGASKQFEVPFLCSEETTKMAGSEFRFRELDNILAMGMDEPMKIFEYLPDLSLYVDYTDENLALYSEGLEEYRQSNWGAAKQSWTSFASKVPGDKAVQIMLARLPYLETVAPADWSGIWQMTDK